MPIIVRTAADLSTGFDMNREIEELSVDVKMLQADQVRSNPEAAKHFLNEIIKRANSCLAKLNDSAKPVETYPSKYRR